MFSSDLKTRPPAGNSVIAPFARADEIVPRIATDAAARMERHFICASAIPDRFAWPRLAGDMLGRIASPVAPIIGDQSRRPRNRLSQAKDSASSSERSLGGNSLAMYGRWPVN